MQQVAFTTDLNVLKSLYDKLNLGEVRGANVVLLDGEKTVGICRMKIDGEVTIEELAILKAIFSARNYYQASYMSLMLHFRFLTHRYTQRHLLSKRLSRRLVRHKAERIWLLRQEL